MRKWITLLIVVLAFVVQMVVVMPSGTHYCAGDVCGTFFWGAHEHDGVWHLALINNGLSTSPPQFPTFAGAMLTGYNALLDWLIKIFHTITNIPVLFIYFKMIPILWFISMVYVWTKFAKNYSTNKWFVPALLFFVFFGNSFSYLFRFYHEGIIWGASGLLSMQSPQVLNNIQFALTLPLLGIMLTIFYKQKADVKDAIYLGILNFAIMGLKFYGGAVALAMSIAYAFSLLLMSKKRAAFITLTLILLGFISSTFLFYNPLGSGDTSSILSFKPLSTVHPIIEERGLFFAPSIANLRNNLYGSPLSIRLILIELATVALFVVFNWGTRIIGLLSIKRKPFELILLSGILVGFLANILFVQRGEWWNTVQFLYYGTFLSNILAASVLATLIVHKDWWRKILAVIIVVLTLPNAIDTYRIFSSFPPHSYVSDIEMKSLEYLKSLEPGVVLALPLNPLPAKNDLLPRPLYNMYDTAYVSAFSGQQSYFNDVVQMKLMGIDYADRLANIKSSNCKVLSEIKYIYVAGDQSQLYKWQKCQDFGIKNIFENDESSIYIIEK